MHLAELRAKVLYAAKLVFLTVGDAINRAATENGVKRARQSHLAEKEGGKPKKKGDALLIRFCATARRKPPAYGSHDFVTSGDLTLQIVANLKWPT